MIDRKELCPVPKNKIRVKTKDRGVVDVKVVPNQKVIEIHKVHAKGGRILDIASNRVAQRELSAQAYILYMHFMLNLPGYREALSLKHITESTSLSERGYYKAVNELIEKQYLVQEQSKEFSEYYGFYETTSLRPKAQAPPPGASSPPDESDDEI
jgi:hypothetical protein